jgi:CDP-paratose 2-epimerase
MIVTGSSGLVGSEVCAYFDSNGWLVHGIDNNQRASFFGPEGDTEWNRRRLEASLKRFAHHDIDVRDRRGIEDLVALVKPDAIVHAAAQPSHDRAAEIPFEDFDINAVGTLNLLEATRRHAKDAAFILMSTNKVYGDAPNTIRLRELETRWEFDDPAVEGGIGEDLSIDQSTHSLFGASKVAADVLTQEYGRYFDMKTCCLRGGCLTGPAHSGVELHGFLSYLLRCNVEGRTYKIFGYKGKQVRDNIHSRDITLFIDAFIRSPRNGEVYNLGGGYENSCSILEAFQIAESITGRRMNSEYSETNRTGDHICYYSDLRKMKSHYPDWDITVSLEQIFEEIAAGWTERLSSKS